MLAPSPVAGVDVGKWFLDLGFDPAAKPLRFHNGASGIAALIDALRHRGAARMRAAGKLAKVAIVATGRRLVILANALVRDDKTLDESRLAEPERDAREV